MSNEQQKPIVGFTTGDINGIGIELLIKTLSDSRLTDFCTPVIFGNNKVLNFYRKSLPDLNLNCSNLKDLHRPFHKQVNLYNCWEEEVEIKPGELNATGGKYALLSLQTATQALLDKKINALVTAPIHKKNIYSDEFPFTGHTPYLKAIFQVQDVLMMMVSPNMRVGLLSEHIPLQDAAKAVTREALRSKLNIFHQSLQKDFGISKPRLAVLGLNPHAGDNGLIGKEEESLIQPLLKEARQQMLVFGPYAADSFFARGYHEKFDGVLAMYHDQGLIPFKSLAIGEGVNYSAGLPAIRTSPDHGTAFDIAGKGRADHSSMLAAAFEAIEIYNNRTGHAEMNSNPLKKMSARMLANSVDERIEENER
ncbi:MAG: 4-hydroxythreonine-4-phosphate dehydrogenase PdxA [Bacteroidota bacterium]|jgi:4-hydroxythreonine-4-phosphate dehydrogenase